MTRDGIEVLTRALPRDARARSRPWSESRHERARQRLRRRHLRRRPGRREPRLGPGGAAAARRARRGGAVRQRRPSRPSTSARSPCPGAARRSSPGIGVWPEIARQACADPRDSRLRARPVRQRGHQRRGAGRRRTRLRRRQPRARRRACGSGSAALPNIDVFCPGEPGKPPGRGDDGITLQLDIGTTAGGRSAGGCSSSRMARARACAARSASRPPSAAMDRQRLSAM